MTDTVEHTLTAPARPAFLTGVHELVDRIWSADSTLDEAARTRFESALIEVVGNTVVHSPVPEGKDAVTMRLCITCSDDRIVADIRDDGGPVEADIEEGEMPTWTAESGRGLALARAFSDELTYDRTDDENRWVITCLRST